MLAREKDFIKGCFTPFVATDSAEFASNTVKKKTVTTEDDQPSAENSSKVGTNINWLIDYYF